MQPSKQTHLPSASVSLRSPCSLRVSLYPSEVVTSILSEGSSKFSRIILDSARDMNTRMEKRYDKLCTRLYNLRVTVDNMKDSVREFETIVSISTGHASPRTERQSVLEGRVVILRVLRNADVIQNVVEQVLIGTMSNNLQSRLSTAFSKDGGRMIAMAFFARQPNQKYEEFSTGIGLPTETIVGS